MCCDILGYLTSSMPIEDSIEGYTFIPWKLIICDEGVLHVFAPSLHLAGSIFEGLILFPMFFLGGDRLI
jgi:hypothetical protein